MLRKIECNARHARGERKWPVTLGECSTAYPLSRLPRPRLARTLAGKLKDRKDRFRFIVMNRSLEKIARSIYEHGGMLHIESMWLWYLHPLYPRNLVDSTPYSRHDYLGRLAWYVREIEARKSAYQLILLRERCDVLTIDIDQPDWIEIVARAYGFSVPTGHTNIRAAQGKPNAKRSEVEQAIRNILDSIPG